MKMNRRFNLSAAVLVVVACCTVGARQVDRAAAEALSSRASNRLQALHDEADRLTSEERTVLGELRRLELDREIRSEEVRQAEADAAAVAGELATLDAQMATIEQQDQAAMPDLQQRLVSLYKLGRGRYLRLLLSTSNVRQLGQAARMVGVLAGQDRERVTTHQRRIADLTASRRTLQERQARLAALRADAERARAAGVSAVAARNALVREIDQRRDLNAQLSGDLLVAQQKLQSTLSELSAGSAVVSAASLPIGPFRGDLDWPVAGTVRQRFAGTDATRRSASNGIDIAAPEGAPVHAVHDGVVAFADVFAGFGRLVIVDHGGQTFSLYGNLKEITAVRGAHLQGGDSLGSAGVAATGAEGLYFELRVDGRAVDPLQWLKKR